VANEAKADAVAALDTGGEDGPTGALRGLIGVVIIIAPTLGYEREFCWGVRAIGNVAAIDDDVINGRLHAHHFGPRRLRGQVLLQELKAFSFVLRHIS
jgi:hypothetical protein